MRAATHAMRPRLLFHPGASLPVRITALAAPGARHLRLALGPGRSLHEAIVEPLARLGIASASLTLLGGAFRRIAYCVAPPDPSGRAVIAYSQPIEAGAAEMIFGNATLGLGLDGRPLVHCHATLRTEAGEIRGGHILPQEAMIGDRAVPALVTALEGFMLRQVHDPETNIALLQPVREAPAWQA